MAIWWCLHHFQTHVTTKVKTQRCEGLLVYILDVKLPEGWRCQVWGACHTCHTFCVPSRVKIGWKARHLKINSCAKLFTGPDFFMAQSLFSANTTVHGRNPAPVYGLSLSMFIHSKKSSMSLFNAVSWSISKGQDVHLGSVACACLFQPLMLDIAGHMHLRSMVIME